MGTFGSTPPGKETRECDYTKPRVKVFFVQMIPRVLILLGDKSKTKLRNQGVCANLLFLRIGDSVFDTEDDDMRISAEVNVTKRTMCYHVLQLQLESMHSLNLELRTLIHWIRTHVH